MPEWELLPKETPPRIETATTPTAAQIGYRKNRLILAFTVAAISDALAVFVAFAPPLQWALDVATAVALFLILGSQWMILPGLIAEAIPGIAVFPFWILVVASIAAWGKISKQRN